MSDELKFPGPSGSADRDSLNEPLAGRIREAYAPVAADSDLYWVGLEGRIMARIRTEGAGDGRWWTVLAPWAQAGLIAAAAIFAVTTVINQRLADSDSQYAYESVIQVSAPTSGLSAAIGSSSDRATGTDATLNYVLSH